MFCLLSLFFIVIFVYFLSKIISTDRFFFFSWRAFTIWSFKKALRAIFGPLTCYRWFYEPTCTVPKEMDFPLYNMKCSGENVILRRKIHVVSCFPLHFILYGGNLGCFSNSVVPYMFCMKLANSHSLIPTKLYTNTWYTQKHFYMCSSGHLWAGIDTDKYCM